jgi:hypothetical protein
MVTKTNSSEIITECLKEHGKGEIFPRTDGLQFEARRAAARHRYLEAHLQLSSEHRQLILQAAATPGMTREDVIAAWGLLEEDTRTVFGHVTDDRLSAYAYFKGFAIGALHALYLKDDVVVGIRQTDELVQPHEDELAMRLAEENAGLHYFYEGNDDRLRGSDVDQFHIDWDTLHHHLYRVEVVMPIDDGRIKRRIEAKGLIKEYEIRLLRLGHESWTAPTELRSLVALGLLPYPDRDEPDAPGPSSGAQTLAPGSVVALPPSSLTSEPGASLPPAEWSAYVAEGGQHAAFPAAAGEVELLKVEWVREQLFRVGRVPLRVNGVSLDDLVELEWLAGEAVPRFKQVAERRARTIRALMTDPAREDSVRHFAKLHVADRKRYRYEKPVLAFTIVEPELDELMKEWLGYLPVTWVYTDTLSQK